MTGKKYMKDYDICIEMLTNFMDGWCHKSYLYTILDREKKFTFDEEFIILWQRIHTWSWI